MQSLGFFSISANRRFDLGVPKANYQKTHGLVVRPRCVRPLRRRLPLPSYAQDGSTAEQLLSRGYDV